MANYGFAIDLPKCIGCHACTIACKAEHDIPIGVNRCWVKSVEKGTFPEARRFFLPVLCNQCDEAPCARICPTNALFKRRDGIVDLNSEACIGCRACMVACPYDQLFIDPNTSTAEKCNFCANRIENDLLPSCVSVCPTQCRIFGDLDDPSSEISRLAERAAVTVRKPEKGTLPKVLYIGAESSTIQPEIAARPLQFKEGQVTLRPLGAPAEGPQPAGGPRVDYDVPHHQPWGVDMAIYLLTKGIATGALFLSALLWWLGYREPLVSMGGAAIAVVFVTITAAVLVLDLDRPDRFYYILTRPNWRSWMVWGAYFLMAHGLLAAAWLVAAWLDWPGALDGLVVPCLVVSLLATSYTGFLFAQGLARDLWQGPHAAIDLLAQAAAEATAVMLLLAVTVPSLGSTDLHRVLGATLCGALAAHLILILIEQLASPSPSRHHELALVAIKRGAYAVWFWGGAVLIGGVLPLGILAMTAPWGAEMEPTWAAGAATLALAGGFAWEYVWVEAGQCVPLS